ncbi:sigma 54-interacting transcriptional regulator, partial [Shigella flexneri]
MKRSERILKHLQDYVINLDSQNISEETGLHSQQLAEQLGLLRNNVSQELNHLCRQGVVIKLKTHPVRFLPKDFAEKYFVYTKQNDEWTFIRPDVAADSEDPFIRLIGHASSLREQVVQAKAAILYPPHGLHTLITGQTGVGKSLFASLMFEYARSSAILNKDAPFIVFNCADYYNNPQLLMGHLFGYTRGAYTGAENDKDGIIARANGGILFLDEIHRLPPEGQEMIFYFMDTGR